MTNKIVVLVTCTSAKEARRIARVLVDRKLAACVSILQPPVVSVYQWKKRIQFAREVLLVIKTSGARFVDLEREVKRLHGYKIPEIIALPIIRGSRDYLAWLSGSVRPTKG
jgi:periplasmic divalent cation tolerance protein